LNSVWLIKGVYADLDVESILPIGEVLKGNEMALCLMGKADWVHSTPNSWMASKPGTYSTKFN